jgi:simple sugar transport system permease protein
VRARWIPLVSAVAALGLTVALAAASLAVGGHSPVEAFAALLGGALGSPEAIVSITLVRTVPLLLTGLAVALAFRAGVWNIGAEGQLYAGAAAAVWVGLQVGGLPAWIAAPAVLACAALAGAAWAAIPTFMKLRLGVGEVITTLLLNFVAIDLAAWLVHGPLQEPRGVFPQSESIVEAARLPLLVPGSRLHVGFLLAVVLAVGLAVTMRATRVGFLVKAVGASNDAARVAGRMSVGRVVAGAFLVSGAIAGLAGGVEVAGVTWALYENLSPGHGYTAIAVALLAGLHPVGVVGTALLFGILEGGASAMQRSAGVPAAWVDGVQALVILSVLVVDQVVRKTMARPRGADG